MNFSLLGYDLKCTIKVYYGSKTGDPQTAPGAERSKMTRNMNGTAAELHQRWWGFSLGEGVDSHHL